MPYADRERQREYRREWYAARRAAWFAANGPCAQCGSWERLELDHVDPATKVHHVIWSWSDARREAELAKCQILCVDCHDEKTAGEWHGRWNGNAQPHSVSSAPGTTGYRRGCRCGACCRAQSDYRAAYNARTSRRAG